jgi:tetratricopeptide (TPR) repeat protein
MKKNQPIHKNPSKIAPKAPLKPLVKEKKSFFFIPSFKRFQYSVKSYFPAAFRFFVLMPFRQLLGKTKPDFRQGNNYIYRLIFISIFSMALVGMPLLSFDYGISWDEKIQRDYAKDIIKYYETGGKDTTLFDQTKHLYNTMLYYGCSFDVLTGVLQDKILKTNDEFALRHFVNAIFGVIMLLYTARIARFLGTWRTACLALVFGLLSPSLFGHAMNNPKDIPFAASYIVSIYYMIRFLAQLPKPTWANLIGMAIGIGWTISTRAGGLILVAFLVMFTGLYWLYQFKKEGIAKAFGYFKNYAFYVGLVAVAGYFIGLVIWPYGQIKPFHNPFVALSSLSNVNYLYTYENFEGNRIYMGNVPWYYILKLISIGSPIFILLGCLFAIGFAKKISLKYNYWLIGFLFFIFFFPILYVAYKNSTLYNGWRHFLFVYLSLVVIAAIGWEYIVSYFSYQWIKYVAQVGLLVLIGKVGFWMIVNHPNQYIYFNELVGGTKGAYADYETDYYSNTVKQAVEWLIKNEPVKHKKVKVVSNNELLTVSYLTEKLADSIQVLWTRDYERQKQDWDYAIFTTRTFGPSQIKNGYFPPKGTIYTIDVDGVPVCAIVKRPNKLMSQGYSFSTKSNFEAALPYFLEALKTDTTDEEASRMIGLCMLNLNKTDEAISFINKAINLFPEGFMAYYLKGFYYLTQQDDANAEKYFKKSIDNRINNGDAHGELGNIYLKKGDFSKAMSTYNDAIQYGNSKPYVWTNLANAHLQVGDYDTALNYLDIALSKNENFVPAYETLLECFEKMGNTEAAQQVMQALVKLRGY